MCSPLQKTISEKYYRIVVVLISRLGATWMVAKVKGWLEAVTGERFLFRILAWAPDHLLLQSRCLSSGEFGRNEKQNVETLFATSIVYSWCESPHNNVEWLVTLLLRNWIYICIYVQLNNYVYVHVYRCILFLWQEIFVPVV